MREPGLQVLADQVVFLQELGEVVARVIARAPGLDDPEPEPVGMCFLAHLFALFLRLRLAARLLGLGTLALGLPRPHGRGYGIRFPPLPPVPVLFPPVVPRPFPVDLPATYAAPSMV